MTSPTAHLQPRKQPLQARAAITVDAILVATVHILEQAKDGRFTTKQVAERSGVSIGSLYQYFPNKQALVAELVRRKLAKLVEVTDTASRAAPKGVEAGLAFVLDAVIAEKARTLKLSLALHETLKSLDMQPIVQPHTDKIFHLCGSLIESRIERTLSEAEKSRLKIAIDGIEGAMSKIAKSTPADFRNNNATEALKRMFIATLNFEM